MSWVILSSRISGKSSRTKVESVDFQGKAALLKTKASTTLGVPIHEIELVYSGQRLKDDEPLTSYGVKPGVTVHLLKKAITDVRPEVPDKMDSAAIQQVVTALQAALINPAYRTVVEKMLASTETLENLIATTPGLDRDPVAMAMLQDPELLAILADPSHIHRVIEAHPSLGQAAMLVAAAVNEEGAEGGSGAGTSARATYSLDHMSDDEDLIAGNSRGRGGATGQAAQAITSSQLAAALAASMGSALVGSSGSSSSSSTAASSDPPPPSASAPQPAISASFFRQALQAAAAATAAGGAGAGAGAGAGGGGETEAAAPPPPQTQVTESQLQQLRDMGITDEAVARRALEASGGDIQAALELIFGDMS